MTDIAYEMWCQNNGVPLKMAKTCPECNGEKVMYYSCCSGEPVEDDIKICHECREHLGEEDCNTCNGSGQIIVDYE